MRARPHADARRFLSSSPVPAKALLTARTQLFNPAAPANPREMAKKKKAAPEEAPKKGKKKAAAKK